MRAALAILLLIAASAEAQAPPQPAIVSPARKPAVNAPAKPAAPVETLKAELASVDARIATYEQAQKERDRLAKSRGAISGMNMEDMLQLQKMMERKAELERMISNTMKSGSEPGQPAPGALKAS